MTVVVCIVYFVLYCTVLYSNIVPSQGISFNFGSWRSEAKYLDFLAIELRAQRARHRLTAKVKGLIMFDRAPAHTFWTQFATMSCLRDVWHHCIVQCTQWCAVPPPFRGQNHSRNCAKDGRQPTTADCNLDETQMPTLLYCTLLYCTVQYSTVLYSTVPYFTVLIQYVWLTVQYCSTVYVCLCCVFWAVFPLLCFSICSHSASLQENQGCAWLMKTLLAFLQAFQPMDSNLSCNRWQAV